MKTNRVWSSACWKMVIKWDVSETGQVGWSSLAQISAATVESRSLIFRRESTAPKQDKFSLKMAALDDCLPGLCWGIFADGPEQQHLQGRRAVCGQVIIDWRGTTWGGGPHTCKLAQFSPGLLHYVNEQNWDLMSSGCRNIENILHLREQHSDCVLSASISLESPPGIPTTSLMRLGWEVGTGCSRVCWNSDLKPL